jgi:hypothetical protein
VAHRVTSVDLRTYARDSGPLPPHRAALLAAELAEHLASVHAGGAAYGGFAPEKVRVDSDGVRVSVAGPASRAEPHEPLAAADVRGAGAVLAELLGERDAGGPAVLWAIVDACAAGPSAQPAAAVLASQLRDAVRDLLLGSAWTPPAHPSRGAAPRYLPDLDPRVQPAPLGGRARSRRAALVAGATAAAAIVLAATVVLAPPGGTGLRTARVAIPSPTPADAAATASPSPVPSGGDPGAAAAPAPAPTPSDDSGQVPAAPAGPPPADQALALTATPPAPAATATPGPAPRPSATAPPMPPRPSTSFPTNSFSASPSASGVPVAHGWLIWYNRSVGVSSVVFSSSSCASAAWTGFAGGKEIARYQTASRCGSVDVSQTLNASTVVGGIAQVIVDLYVNGTRVARESCLRRTHACTRA